MLLVAQRVLCLKMTCGLVLDNSFISESWSALIRSIQFIVRWAEDDILSFAYCVTVGQPVLRLGLQLLINAVTVINTIKTKNTFFIIFLLKLKNLLLQNSVQR